MVKGGGKEGETRGVVHAQLVFVTVLGGGQPGASCLWLLPVCLSCMLHRRAALAFFLEYIKNGIQHSEAFFLSRVFFVYLFVPKHETHAMYVGK